MLPNVLLLSEMIGRAVCGPDGRTLGRLADLTVRLGESGGSAAIHRILVRNGQDVLLPWAAVESLHHPGLTVALAGTSSAVTATADALLADEILLVRDVLDTQIVDIADNATLQLVGDSPRGEVVRGVEREAPRNRAWRGRYTSAGRLGRNAISVHQLLQQTAHLLHRNVVVDHPCLQRIERHVGIGGFGWLLYEGGSTGCLDCPQSGYPVVEHSRKQESDRIRTVICCCRTEQGVYGRTMPVLGRLIGQREPLVVHQKMAIRDCRVYLGRLHHRALRRRYCGQRTGTIDDLRQHRWCRGRLVEHHQYRSGELPLKNRSQFREGLHSPGGRADDDHYLGGR
jgi:sporulation protein YlmC with PRC-barrel domain